MAKCTIYQNYMECEFPKYPNEILKNALYNSRFRWIPNRQVWQGNIDENIKGLARVYNLDIIDMQSIPQNDYPTRELEYAKDAIIIHGMERINPKKEEFVQCNFKVLTCSKIGTISHKLIQGIFFDISKIEPKHQLRLCFISDDNYKELKKDNYIILNRVATIEKLDDYIKSNENNERANASLMHQYGYCVNEASNRTEAQRHAVIDNLIEHKIKDADSIIDFISWLESDSCIPAKPETKAKWENDIEYIRKNYNIPAPSLEDFLI